MNVILTLTSISSRLSVLKYTMLSLLEQSYPADKLVLFLSKEPYLLDKGVSILPDWLVNMAKNKEVDIRWVENTGPYRKLIHLYKHAKEDDWIVTCDDDVIYGSEWLASLVETAKQYQDAIVCGRARKPKKNILNVSKSYICWPLVPAGSMGKELLPIGIAGVLYRKDLLSEDLMLSNDFRLLAPKQDDLWFNLARNKVGKNVVVSEQAGHHIFPIETPGALSANNASSKVAGWDNFIKAVYHRLLVRVKGYFGFPVCENDIALKKLKNYVK